MGLLTILAMSTLVASPSTRLVGVTDLPEFPASGQEVVRVIPGLDPGFAFDQAICSWNIQPADGASIKVEARVFGQGFETKWYTLGKWSPDAKVAPRESLGGQRDANGTVETDTLSLTKPGRRMDLQVTLSNLGASQPKLKLLTVSFLNSKAADTPMSTSPSSAWGKVVDVPQRAQGNYPRGGVLCSPTSISMILWHYANVLNRPEMNKDVPEVEAGVWDNVYGGAGNWPFNTAYVGSFPGMRAHVARLTSIADLEQWIDAGLPVTCSVSFDMLRGKALSPDESGHLVVLVGFEANGDPIINDPAFVGAVRRTYKRADFEKAWVYSKRTVYLVYPVGTRLPDDPDHLWTVG